MEKIKVNKDQIRELIKFLIEYNFVLIDQEYKKVKLEETIQKFLTQTLL